MIIEVTISCSSNSHDIVDEIEVDDDTFNSCNTTDDVEEKLYQIALEHRNEVCGCSAKIKKDN